MLPRPGGHPLAPVWEHTVGSGRTPLALRADWQAQLRRCREVHVVRHIRFHRLLDDAMSACVVHSHGNTTLPSDYAAWGAVSSL